MVLLKVQYKGCENFMSQKIIKDSIHGYITLETMFAYIVDTPEFQRLKSIEQGSFRVLYPAARHDRFIHSLGTFHLSKKFAMNFIINIEEDLNISVSKRFCDKVTNTFYYALLLHDIGHAPFSHTTEKFFKRKTDEEGNAVIEKKLFSVIENYSSDKLTDFKKEYKGSSPSPHEIISAIILVEKSDEFLKDKVNEVDLELAARMVIGCTYDYNNYNFTKKEKEECGIKNCFIRLLNSQTVDVDKLDYITRDTEMSGFFNVPIDIDRLVSSVTAIRESDGYIYPAFRKNALSVIDNVFRAKTEQSLWMVSHPVVLYDSELLSYCINRLHDLIDEAYISNVFSIEALGIEGVEVSGKKYRLLNDIDINADLRRFYGDSELIKELYERQSRRHPVWKSYYEYKYLFDTNEALVFKYFKSLVDYMVSYEFFVLNETTYKKIFKDKEANEHIKKSAKFLKEFCETEHLTFDLSILGSSNSFSTKFDPERVFISFSKLPKRNNQNFVTYEYLKKSSESENKRFFYMYSKQKFSLENIEHFIESINKEIKAEEKSNRKKKRA